jgi:dethiobiotin synthetase
MKRYFVSAIGTDSGKTLVSAILCKALDAAYWKPIQAGYPTDTDTIKGLSPKTLTFPEAYLLDAAMSPHAAADLEGTVVDLDQIKLPNHTGNLIVEGAGGLMVPLNHSDLIIDLVKKLELEVILVSNIYLGSINHTLLSVEALKARGIPVKGIIFNGSENLATTSIITKHTGFETLLHLPPLEEVNKDTIAYWAKRLKKRLDELN